MEDEKDTNVSEIKVISNWKRFIVPIFLLIAIGGTVYLVNLSDNWFMGEKITEYEVNGLNLNDSDKFFELAKKISFGKTKDSVILKKIEEEVEKDAYIKKCVASFASQSMISLDLVERYPFAFYNIGGNLNYIDQEGTILPYKVLKDYSDLVIVSGFLTTDTTLIKAAINIIDELNKKQEVLDFVSEIRYIDDEKGFELIGPFEKAKIYLGLDDNIENKFDKLRILMSDRSARVLLTSVKTVDLRWLDRIVIEEI
ncbi:MAG: hypothetical protein CVV25_06045 [Ignavibacteriae bacterium HGW-Ignavibacteriae-4]|nr:MAG: hypothetical protein CVV25_06045 [Ignavibacteriae bacterium HGW-Ignavibacteriae-4]